MLWRTVFEKRVAPLELTFWLFHTNFLLLPALSQSAYHRFYHPYYIYYSQEQLLFACFLIALGLLAFWFGTVYGRKKTKKVNRNWIKDKFLLRQFQETWALKFGLVSIIAIIVVMVLNLGTEFFISPRTAKMGQVDSQVEGGLLIKLPQALCAGSLLFSIAFLIQQWRLKQNISLFMKFIFCAALVLNAIVNFPLGLPRYWFFGYLISMGWLIFTFRFVIWRSLFVLGITLMQFTVFPWFSEITRGKGLIGIGLQAFRLYLFHGDFDGFQQIVNITLYINDNGLELGRNLLSTALFFVPRAIWNKAEPLGNATAKYMGYFFTNICSPIYGEFYADFGLFSLVTGMGILGVAVRLFDEHYDMLVNTGRTGVGVLLSSTLAGYFIIILRGSLLGVLPSIATLLGVLFVLSWIAGAAKPKISSNNFQSDRHRYFKRKGFG